MIKLADFSISLRRGDTSVHQFTLDYVNEDGDYISPVDLTGWNVLAQARYDQQQLLYHFPVEINAAAGIISFYVDSPTSKSLLPVGTPVANARWEMQATIPNLISNRDEVVTFAGGAFSVHADLIDSDYPTTLSKENGCAKCTVTSHGIYERGTPVPYADIDFTRIRVTYQESNPEFDAENAKISYVEGLAIIQALSFDDLDDTPPTKQPNTFVVTDGSGILMEYANPVVVPEYGIEIDRPNLIDSPVIRAKVDDGLQANESGIAVDNTVVRTSRRVTAGQGLTQTGTDLGSDITVDLHTPNSSGLRVNADNITIDMAGATEKTTVLGTDVFLLEDTNGVKFRVTRDNLLSGLGTGIEIRGSVNPKSSDPTPITSLTVTGDPLNATISQGTAPSFVTLTPAGYTYIVLLDDADKNTGVDIELGDPAGTVWTVFDQDQISWVGDAANGSWQHLETGDSVINVFGRVGVITAENDDYTAAQITNVPSGNLIANNVQDALNELQGDIDQLDTDITDLDGRVVHTTGDENIGGRKRFTNSDSVRIPVGTTAQRGIGEDGAERINTDTGRHEYYVNGAWHTSDSLVWLDHAMSKTEFDALAEKRKRDQAGSGFLEWGLHYNDGGTFQNINQGMWSRSNESLRIPMGRLRTENALGVSRTVEPIAVVNGIKHKIDLVARNSQAAAPNFILFPEAETGTRSYDSDTGAVIDYLVDTDPKYGDVAGDLNEAVARNFEGKLRNGDFRLGVQDWSFTGTGASYVVNNGIATVTAGGNLAGLEQNGDVSTRWGFSTGDTVVARCQVRNATLTSSEIQMTIEGGAVTPVFQAIRRDTEWTTIELETEITGSGFVIMRIRHTGTGAGGTFEIKEASLRKKEDNPILSRQDYVYMESFHELISEKDVFLPLGNTQFGATSDEDGIPTSTLTGLGIAQGYSAFGIWDTTTIGRGARWSTLTDAQKQTVLANPYNNIYLNDEGELVQVRYRFRIIRGKGNGWYRDYPSTGGGNGALQFDSKTDPYVLYQGKDEAVPDEFGSQSSRYLYQTNHANGIAADVGIFNTPNRGVSLPIALVQRGNQGAYHPSLNPEGFGSWMHQTTDFSIKWYDANTGDPTSTAQAFNVVSDGTRNVVGVREGSGTIARGTGHSGRTDQYDFHNAIYAGQVHDLRLNANKQDTNRLLEDAIRKAVAGETRGKGKVPFSTAYDDAGTGTNPNAALQWSTGSRLAIYSNLTNGVKAGDWCYLYDSTVDLIVRFLIDSVVTSDDYFQSEEIATSTNFEVLQGTLTGNGSGNTVHYILEKELTAEYDDLPWVDIIGEPSVIQENFPNGVVGQWIPVLPPSSGSVAFPHNEKISDLHGRALLDNNTKAWSYSTSPTGTDLTTNETVQGYRPHHLILYNYSAWADFTEPFSRRGVYGDVGDVVATSAATVNRGNRLMPSLTGDIGKSSRVQSYAANYAVTDVTYELGDTLEDNSVRRPQHARMQLDTENDSNAVKALPHLIENEGLLYVQYHGQQMVFTPRTIVDDDGTNTTREAGSIRKVTNTNSALFGSLVHWDTDYTGTYSWQNLYRAEDNRIRNVISGNLDGYVRAYTPELSWGVDNEIIIVNSEVEVTDLNGNRVTAFTHSELIPIGIADKTLSN